MSYRPPADEHELEVLLKQHAELREGIRIHGRRKNRRLILGITATAAIIGYSYGASDASAWIMASAPVLLSFVLLAHVLSLNWVATLASEICEIQARIDVEGFSYERTYGVLSLDADDPRRVGPINVHDLTVSLFYALVAAVYIGTAIVGLYELSDSSVKPVAGLSAPGVAFWAYVVLFAMLTVAVCGHLLLVARLKSKLHEEYDSPDERLEAVIERLRDRPSGSD